MTQKIIQVGNSAAIIISKQLMEEAGFFVGEEVEVNATKNPFKIEVLPRKPLRKKSGITQAFAKSVDEFIKAYKPALEELAKR